MGVPGQQYFAGTHLNPNVTWWSKSAPFFAYLNRCQYLLQQGLFVADVAYYYGDHVPNFAQLKKSDPAHILPGYDYDVVTEEVILKRMSVRDGRLVLPDGMSYRVLVLPDRPNISLPVLRKLKELVTAGATIIGPKPQYATGLTDFPKCDEEVARLAGEMWGARPRAPEEVVRGRTTYQETPDGVTTNEHRLGQGRVIQGKTARAVLMADGMQPDFAFTSNDPNAALDYIHRRDGQTEIYFVANRSTRPLQADCTFRVTNKPPQVWDPMTGQVRSVPVRASQETPDGVTTNALDAATRLSFAINLPAAESRTDPMPVEELEKLGVSLQPPVAVVSEVAQRAARHHSFSEMESRQKLWRWVLGVTLIVLLIETWLGGWLVSQTRNTAFGDPLTRPGATVHGQEGHATEEPI
jgi:hypothetical protein